MLGAQLGERLDQVDQALERDVGAGGGDDPAGDLGDGRVGRPQVGVGADVDHADAVLADPEVLDDLPAGGAGDGEDGGQSPGDALLHAGEGVPAADGGAALPVGGGVQLQLPVDGDRVVDRGHQRGAEGARAAEESVSEGLVVVDDVEVAAAGGEGAAGAQREGQRLREAAGPHGGDLQGVDPVPVLLALRGAERVGLAVEVEAGDLGERDALVERGVRLGAEDLDAVAEPGELTGEVPDVDALAAAERVPLVREESDPQRTVTARRDTLPGACLYGLRGHVRPPSSVYFAGA